MRKKILAALAVAAVMALVLSLTAFAADEIAMTDYGFLTVFVEKLRINLAALFNTLNAIYVFFANLFG